MHLSIRRISLVLLLTLATGAALAAAQPISLQVDLTDAPRRILHGRLSIPVSPGPMTLYYPEWIPGEHGPTGPISDLVGIRMTAAGRPLAWERDPLELYTFRVVIPEGVERLEIELDYLSPSAGGKFTHGPATSDRLAMLSWNTLLLYPEGRPVDEILLSPSLLLPPGWSFGTALEAADRQGDTVTFQPVSLATLIDSPVAAGRHHRVFDLTGSAPVPHRLHVVADSEAALAMRPETQAAYARLVAEGLALFGAHHYDKYDFLLVLSDHVTHFGLEHHESSDNRLPERTLLEDDLLVGRAGLLPHEFVHSWNGKHRRPAGLTRSTYQEPFVDDLLWVYEGLTSYLGTLLTARSGLWSPEHSREYLALTAAGLDNKPGRSWRPLADTARAAQTLFRKRSEGSSWRRGVDFYPEGLLIWLEADTIIRRVTAGSRSLDDFCRGFHGGSSGPAEVKPFTLEELVAALEGVAPYDWRGFFDERIRDINLRAPLGGLTGSGWILSYGPELNAHQRIAEQSGFEIDLRFSLGLSLRHKTRHADNGRVLDVIVGSPADQAGVAPGMKLVAVNGRRWSPAALRAAIAGAGQTVAAIELLLENGDYFRTHEIDYHGGELYPHLQSDPTSHDLLSEIFRPRVR